MTILLPLFFLSCIYMVTYTNGAVCVCKDDTEQALQKVIDYACASGADCAQIQQTGACFQPNTVKNHCDVAVNSYYQKKASTGATCDFNGAATISTTPPSTTSTCLSSSASIGNSTTGTPTTGNSTAGSPPTSSPINGMFTNSSSSNSSGFPGNAMGPSGTTGFDPSRGEELSVQTATVIVLTTLAAVALWV